jgi:hypothetical protein
LFDVFAPYLPLNAAEHLSGNDDSQSVCVGQIHVSHFSECLKNNQDDFWYGTNLPDLLGMWK